MKRLATLALGLAMLMPMGCKKTGTTQPLAPGYLNQADQVMGETLAAARGFYLKFEDGVTSGQYTETAAEKAAFQQFSVSLNVADAAYLGYHAGTTTQAQAQAAVNAVTAQQSSIISTYPNAAGAK